MKEKIFNIFGWCMFQGGDLATNFMRDLKSIRALWNYLFLALYTWVIVWLVLYHAETCGNTAIITTGTLVTAVFTNYVWSSRMDKKQAETVPGLPGVNGAQAPAAPAAPATQDPDNG